MNNSENIVAKKAPPAIVRWLVLLFISLGMFGNYYIYDSISPLADLLVKQLKFTDSDIGLLNGIYSFPNIIMVLIGGIIIDRIGTKKSALLFSMLVLIGAFVTTIKGNIYVMASGRLIFGLGAESMIVAITTVVARWFKGKELSFAFGLNLTVARLGSFLALNSPTWGKSFYTYWQDPLFVGVGAGVISVLTLSIYYFIDKYSEKRYDLPAEGNQDKIDFKGLFKFGKSFWFISLLCVTFYSAMFPFQTFAIKFFQDAHNVTREYAGFLSSILTLSAMICTPLFGLLADYIGKRSLLMMFGSLIIIPVYLIMGYTDINLIIPMSIMGLAFSMIPAVMWPSVAIVVEPAKLGTAYGLMTMIQNIGLFGFNILVGWANDLGNASAANPSGYHLGMWVFSACGFFGLFFAFMLRRNETGGRGHGLEFGIMHRKKMKQDV
ncbi:MAG: MFS transporter [Bacteroidales bacterium]|nr:MFS transporter [Bacteroidales bacterium]